MRSSLGDGNDNREAGLTCLGFFDFRHVDFLPGSMFAKNGAAALILNRIDGEQHPTHPAGTSHLQCVSISVLEQNSVIGTGNACPRHLISDLNDLALRRFHRHIFQT